MSQVKTAAVPQVIPQAPSLTQQISILNSRVNETMTHLNIVMKTMADENAALKKENADLKAKQKTSKQ